MIDSVLDEFPKVEPEVVAFSGQTIEEVNKILNAAKEAEIAANKDFKKVVRRFREAKPCPEVVALSGQTVEEVKEIINKSNKTVDPNLHLFKEEKKCKLTFDGELSGCSVPDVNAVRGSAFKHDVDDFVLWRRLTGINKEVLGQPTVQPKRIFEQSFEGDVDVFSLWRKLANVKLNDVEPNETSPAKKLMDYILARISTEFPNLELEWEEHWNPRLLINNCTTKISMEKLSMSYQGLLHITEEFNAQEIICNIIVKKIKELFI
jgi:hypothetical protein